MISSHVEKDLVKFMITKEFVLASTVTLWLLTNVKILTSVFKIHAMNQQFAEIHQETLFVHVQKVSLEIQ